MTLDELYDAWERSSLYEDIGKPLSRRTFQRWREETELLFDVKIGWKDGYRYYIEDDGSESDSISSWLIHTLSVSNTVESFKNQRDHILLEEVPTGTEYLETILEAIRDRYQLKVTYHNFKSKDANLPAIVNPLCVKLSERRWYVVVDFAEKENYRRVMSLDRIEELEMLDSSFTMPPDFNARRHFKDSYGITVMQDKPAEKVVLKVPDSAVPYLRSLPFHTSQREIRKEEGYVFMEYTLKITDELAYALLRHASRSEIIQPVELREKVAEIARQIVKINK